MDKAKETASSVAGLARDTAGTVAQKAGNVASAVSSAVVYQATPSITWPVPPAITYGTALSSTQLDASASVQGSFSYSPAAVRVVGAGRQMLSVTFTPTDTADYTTATASVTLTVNQATPVITWAINRAFVSRACHMNASKEASVT